MGIEPLLCRVHCTVFASQPLCCVGLEVGIEPLLCRVHCTVFAGQPMCCVSVEVGIGIMLCRVYAILLLGLISCRYSLQNGHHRSDRQVVSETDCSIKRLVFDPHLNAGFQCGAWSLHRRAFYDAITGPTDFIISIVNSVKMVNMP